MARDGGLGGERSTSAASPRIRVSLRLPPGSDCSQQQQGHPFQHGVAVVPTPSDAGRGGRGDGANPTQVQVRGSDGTVRRLRFSQVASSSVFELCACWHVDRFPRRRCWAERQHKRLCTVRVRRALQSGSCGARARVGSPSAGPCRARRLRQPASSASLRGWALCRESPPTSSISSVLRLLPRQASRSR